MMNVIEHLLVRLSGDAANYQKMLQQSMQQTQRWSAEMTRMGTAASAAITAPITAAAGMAVRDFADFDKAMVESTSIMVGLSEQTKQSMRETALALSGRTQTSAEDLAKSYYYLASAGFSAEEAIALLPKVQEFATAGAFDMARATDLLGASMNVMGFRTGTLAEQTESLTRTTSTLARITTLALGSTQEYAEALAADAGAAARFYGVEIEEVVAALGVLGDTNRRGAAGGTMFARMLRLLGSAATKNAATFQKMGVTVFDSTGEMRPLADVMGDLEKALTPLSDRAKITALNMMGFKALSQRAIMPFIGQSEKLRKFRDELKRVSKTDFAKTVQVEQMTAFANQLKIVWNNVKLVLIDVGKMLAPLILRMTEGVKAAVKWWQSLSPAMKQVLLIAAALAAAVGPVLLAIGFLGPLLAGGFATVWATLSPLLPVVLALGAALLALVAYSGSVEVAWQNLQAWGTTAWDEIKRHAKEFWDWLQPVIVAAKQTMKTTWERVQEFAKAAWEAVVRWATWAWERVVETWDRWTGSFRIDWQKTRDAIIDAFIMAEFAVVNFEALASAAWTDLRMAAELAWTGIKLAAVKALNMVLDRLLIILGGPAVLGALALFQVNWFETWKACARWTGQVLVNAGKNIHGFIKSSSKALLEWVKNPTKGGLIEFKDFLVPLDESKAFGAALKDIPKALGTRELEQRLQKEFDDQLKALQDRLGDQGDKVNDAFQEFRKKRLEMFNKPVPQFSLPPGIVADAAAQAAAAGKQVGGALGDGFGDGVRESMGLAEAVLFRSAESVSRVRDYFDRQRAAFAGDDGASLMPNGQGPRPAGGPRNDFDPDGALDDIAATGKQGNDLLGQVARGIQEQVVLMRDGMRQPKLEIKTASLRG